MKYTYLKHGSLKKEKYYSSIWKSYRTYICNQVKLGTFWPGSCLPPLTILPLAPLFCVGQNDQIWQFHMVQLQSHHNVCCPPHCDTLLMWVCLGTCVISAWKAPLLLLPALCASFKTSLGFTFFRQPNYTNHPQINLEESHPMCSYSIYIFF